MSCGCSNADAYCKMYLYLINDIGGAPAGGPLTLQNVVLQIYAPCVLPVVPVSTQPQMIAWAFDWDDPGSISYNLPNGEVLTITYDGGSVADVDATFAAASTTYYAQKAAYSNGILITLGLQQTSGP